VHRVRLLHDRDARDDASDEVAVTGIRTDGSEVPLLRDGRWQI
jgi:hypothetical protein